MAAELITDTHNGPTDLPGDAYLAVMWGGVPARWHALGVVVGASTLEEALDATAAHQSSRGMGDADLAVTKFGGSSVLVQRLQAGPPKPPPYVLVDVPRPE